MATLLSEDVRWRCFNLGSLHPTKRSDVPQNLQIPGREGNLGFVGYRMWDLIPNGRDRRCGPYCNAGKRGTAVACSKKQPVSWRHTSHAAQDLCIALLRKAVSRVDIYQTECERTRRTWSQVHGLYGQARNYSGMIGRSRLASWGLLGPLGASGASLGPPWAPSWGLLGTWAEDLMGNPWGLLGLSWGLLASCGPLGPPDLLVASWGSLEPPWALLGPSWGHPGASLGLLGAFCGPPATC